MDADYIDGVVTYRIGQTYITPLRCFHRDDSNAAGDDTKGVPMNQTHAMRAQLELRNKVLTGELPGGTRLFEVPLAEEFQISRTPLRDAMARLAEEGLLDRAANGGFVVRKFTVQHVVDAIELRGVLEGTSARLAAERGADRGALDEMADALSKIDACFEGRNLENVDLEGYSTHNECFHNALARLSGSEVVERAIDQCKRLPFAGPSSFPPASASSGYVPSLYTGQQEHKALVAAIAAREGTRAEAIAREHARGARRNLEHLMASRGDLDGSLELTLLSNRPVLRGKA